MLFSIIVPVYNAEKYLENTINSVLSQSFTDWQLILVNDGSLDASLEICERFAAADDRITVYNQKNAGPSAARNNGIAHAVGDYIMFLDSDDEYLPGALGAVAQVIAETSTDIVMSSSKVINCDNGIVIHEADYVLDLPVDNKEVFFTQIIGKRVAPGPCRYAVKREILHKNNILFPAGITIAEDCLWLNQLLEHIDSVAFNKKPFYQYNIHANSITTNISYSRLEDLMTVCQRLFELAEKSSGKLQDVHLNYCCILSNSLLQHYLRQPAENRKKIKKWVKMNNSNFSKALKMQPPIRLTAFIIGNFNSMLLFAWLVKVKNNILKL